MCGHCATNILLSKICLLFFTMFDRAVTQNVGLTPADCTHTSLATPLAAPHRTCTVAKGMPISIAIAPAVPQKNPTPAKSTASPPAEDLSQLQRRPIPADWNPVPFIPSLKDNAFNVVRDYVYSHHGKIIVKTDTIFTSSCPT